MLRNGLDRGGRSDWHEDWGFNQAVRESKGSAAG
jgi:hypothetical protein